MKKFIVLDTEATETGKVDAANLAKGAQVYDLGYLIADKNGTVYLERRLIIGDVFGNADAMSSAYYAAKLPGYYAALANGSAKLVSLREALQTLKADALEHGTSDVWAFNAYFDRTALNSTIERASNGWRTWALPYGMGWRCIMQFAGSTICKTKKYRKFCETNGYLTPRGQVRKTAEAILQYLKEDTYSEEHTALQDARDELEILVACMKRKKKQPRRIG